MSQPGSFINRAEVNPNMTRSINNFTTRIAKSHCVPVSFFLTLSNFWREINISSSHCSIEEQFVEIVQNPRKIRKSEISMDSVTMEECFDGSDAEKEDDDEEATTHLRDRFRLSTINIAETEGLYYFP